jgi:hypothetical protein
MHRWLLLSGLLGVALIEKHICQIPRNFRLPFHPRPSGMLNLRSDQISILLMCLIRYMDFSRVLFSGISPYISRIDILTILWPPSVSFDAKLAITFFNIQVFPVPLRPYLYIVSVTACDYPQVISKVCLWYHCRAYWPCCRGCIQTRYTVEYLEEWTIRSVVVCDGNIRL